jgi:hypothetical protein
MLHPKPSYTPSLTQCPERRPGRLHHQHTVRLHRLRPTKHRNRHSPHRRLAHPTHRRPRPPRRNLTEEERRNNRHSPQRHRRLLRVLQPQDRQAEGADSERGGGVPGQERRHNRWRNELGADRQAGRFEREGTRWWGSWELEAEDEGHSG